MDDSEDILTNSEEREKIFRAGGVPIIEVPKEELGQY